MMFQVMALLPCPSMNGSTAPIGNKVPKTTVNRVEKTRDGVVKKMIMDD
jgi:hypothetical protein